jgi:ATP-dependent HslUV protease ATP-binding subunit HslU
MVHEADHVLFIASGAVSRCKPSDMLPGLQGPLADPGQVRALTEETSFASCRNAGNLVSQYKALIGTEGVTLDITETPSPKSPKSPRR